MPYSIKPPATAHSIRKSQIMSMFLIITMQYLHVFKKYSLSIFSKCLAKAEKLLSAAATSVSTSPVSVTEFNFRVLLFFQVCALLACNTLQKHLRQFRFLLFFQEYAVFACNISQNHQRQLTLFALCNEFQCFRESRDLYSKLVRSKSFRSA